MIGEIIIGIAIAILLTSGILLIIYGNRFVNVLNELILNSEDR